MAIPLSTARRQASSVTELGLLAEVRIPWAPDRRQSMALARDLLADAGYTLDRFLDLRCVGDAPAPAEWRIRCIVTRTMSLEEAV